MKHPSQDTEGMRMSSFPKNLYLALSLKGFLPEMGNNGFSASTARWCERRLFGYFKGSPQHPDEHQLPRAPSCPLCLHENNSLFLLKVRNEGLGTAAAAGAAGLTRHGDAVPMGCRVGRERAAPSLAGGIPGGMVLSRGLPNWEQEGGGCRVRAGGTLAR